MNDLKDVICDIVHKHDIKCAGLFGSRARGDNRSDSDYDIFIISNVNMDEELEIESELEEKLNNSVDLINLKEDMDRILLKNILNEGIVLYNTNNAFEKIYKFTENFFIENSDFIKLRERELLD